MKSLAVTMIVKNEIHNLPRLFKELNGLVDAIYVTDTGSTDGTFEFLTSNESGIIAGCPVYTSEFKWINDFASARNHNLEFIKEDYFMWLDADDSVISQVEMMKLWKQTSMHLADVWFAPYFYAFNEQGECVCQFIRERVFKTCHKFKFSGIVHEAINLNSYPNLAANGVNTWGIVHKRTVQEAEGDKGRNLRILLDNKDTLDPRLKFYLGKEQFDAGLFKDAAETLMDVLKDNTLTITDRELSLQYVIQALSRTEQYDLAIKYGTIALQLNPERAEYHVLIGETYLAINEPNKARPFFKAALGCVNKGNGMTVNFTSGDCYDILPRMQLARIYLNEGSFQDAINILDGISNTDANDLRAIAYKAMGSFYILNNVPQNEDIVMTTPPVGLYPWDGKLYRENGLGGSETAAVEMFENFSKLTKRNLIIFNHREQAETINGVQYIPVRHATEYFSKWKPKLHIAWRHPARLTASKTIMWCHDLAVPRAETQEYDHIIALSEFHKNYLQVTQGIRKEKIIVSRNGINPDRFKGLDTTKQFGKVIWPNSPDRGLEFAIQILDRVRKEVPFIELHCFYGMENLRKMGVPQLAQKADMLESMIKDRPWIKYIGNVDQNRLAKEFASSEVWLYPANFIETFCISALEALACRAWPVVKDVGALHNTLAEAKNNKMCDLVDLDFSERDLDQWAKLVIEAIEHKKYDDVQLDLDKHSWHSIAKEWVQMFDI